MSLLGIVLNYDKGVIHWDGTDIPTMKKLGALIDTTICEAIYFAQTQSPILQGLEEQQQRFSDADYSKMDMVDNLHISPKSKEQLKSALKTFPILFGGLVKIKPVTIKLEKGTKPYRERCYSIPKSMEESLNKTSTECVKKLWKNCLFLMMIPPGHFLHLLSPRRQETLESLLTSGR